MHCRGVLTAGGCSLQGEGGKYSLQGDAHCRAGGNLHCRGTLTAGGGEGGIVTAGSYSLQGVFSLQGVTHCSGLLTAGGYSLQRKNGGYPPRGGKGAREN